MKECIGHGRPHPWMDSTSMRKRALAVAFILLMTASCIMPVLEADGEDDFNDLYDEVMITVPGKGSDPSITDYILENGETKKVPIYIRNYSDRIVDIQFTTGWSESYFIVEPMDGITLMPAGDREGRDFVKTIFTFSIEEVTGTHYGGRVFVNIRMAYADTEDQSVIILRNLSFLVNVSSNFDTSGNFNKFFGFIPNTLPEPFDTPYIPFIVTLLGVIVMALVGLRILVPFIIRHVDENKERTKKILTLAVLIVAIVLFIDPGLRILGADLDIILTVQKISLTILVIAVAIAVWKIYMIVVESLLTRISKEHSSPIDLSFLPIFSMIGKFILWIGGIALILHIYGFDLTGILISAGIVTLGITMGAQSVLSQLFNGISILLTRPFSEGDYLQINGETYVVKHVKLMYTEFSSPMNDRVITIPNDAVASATITNMSKYDKAYRMSVSFQIPYGEDVEKVEKILTDMSEQNEHVMHDYKKYRRPEVRLMDFTDSGIRLRLDVTVVDFANSEIIMSDMKKELYYRLSEEGIEMPFNRLEVAIMDGGFEKPHTA